MKLNRAILIVGTLFILFFISSSHIYSQTEGDVVYLKNESMLRGLIIEEIPNESIKLKKDDGSVFIIRMDEIEKITKSQKYSQTKEDVVYFKNGSILRGLIIEEIPNESIKLKRDDGSVFVIQMDEIEKITKETKIQEE